VAFGSKCSSTVDKNRMISSMYTRQTWKCNTDNSTSIRRWNVAPEYQRRRSATCRCCPRPRNASRQSAHDEAAQQSFDQLKLALTSPPALAIPLDSGEFILDTDASQGTIGAVLSQIQDGVERVVAYASRRLDRREANYCHLQRITRSGLLFYDISGSTCWVVNLESGLTIQHSPG